MSIALVFGALVVAVVCLVPARVPVEAPVAAGPPPELVFVPVHLDRDFDEHLIDVGCRMGCGGWTMTAFVDLEHTELGLSPAGYRHDTHSGRFENPLSLAALIGSYHYHGELYSWYARYLDVTAAPEATAGDLYAVFESGRALERTISYELPPEDQLFSLDAPPRSDAPCVRTFRRGIQCGDELYLWLEPSSACTLLEQLEEIAGIKTVRVVEGLSGTAEDMRQVLYAMRDSDVKLVWDEGEAPLPGWWTLDEDLRY